MTIFKASHLHILNKAQKKIMEDFSFEIQEKEIWMVIGPNGIGKSSLWETFIGIMPMNGGEILLSEKNISTLEPNERVRLGLKYIAQSNSLFDDLSVLDNLKIVAESLVDTKQERQQQIEKAITLFELEPIVYKKVRMLSGGQKRRAELAKIVIGPALLIMLDEPFAALDEEMTAKLAQVFKKIAQEENLAFLINDHNIPALRKIATHCISLGLNGTTVIEG